MKSWKETLVGQHDTLRTVIERLDKAKQQIVLVTNEDLKLLGVITDGDVRRAVLDGINLEGPCVTIMNPKPQCIAPGTPRQMSLKLMREHVFHHLPIVEADGKVCGLLSLDDPITRYVVLRARRALRAGALPERCRPQPRRSLVRDGAPALLR